MKYHLPPMTQEPAQQKARRAYELFMMYGTPSDCATEYERVLAQERAKVQPAGSPAITAPPVA